jgi:hypothetical protein
VIFIEIESKHTIQLVEVIFLNTIQNINQSIKNPSPSELLAMKGFKISLKISSVIVSIVLQLLVTKINIYYEQEEDNQLMKKIHLVYPNLLGGM